MTTPEATRIGRKLVLPGNTVGGEVGTFYVDFVVWNRDKTESRTLNGLVDTGSTYTLIPEAILEEMGIEKMRSLRFNLADGSRTELPIGRVEIELEGQVELVPVVFGPDPERILLGAVALELFVLAADAAHQRLIPADLTL